MIWLRKLLASLRMWWRAETVVEGTEGCVSTVCVVSVQPGTYAIDINGSRVEYRTKWYDTKRSVARKLGRMVRR